MCRCRSARRPRPHPALTVLQPLVQTVSEGPRPTDRHEQRNCSGYSALARAAGELGRGPCPSNPGHLGVLRGEAAVPFAGMPELFFTSKPPLRSCCICEWESARDSAPEGEASSRCASLRCVEAWSAICNHCWRPRPLATPSACLLTPWPAWPLLLCRAQRWSRPTPSLRPRTDALCLP